MTKTIQAALSPLLIVGSFCGLGLFEYPLGRLRPYISCLYFLITWSLFAYLFYYLVHTSHTTFLYTSWSSSIVLLTAFASMLVSLLRFKGLKICLHKLSVVDETLEMLGTPKEYQQLYNWVIRIIIGWIILSLFLNSLDSFWLSYDYFSITRICVPLVANHLLHVNNYSGLIWGIILRYTGSRFQRINDHIYRLLQNNAEYIGRENELILVGERRIEAMKCKRFMWIIMHVHLQLSVISRELNKVFSIQMTLQMASYFAFFIELFREVYSTYIHKNTVTYGQFLDNFFIHIWGALYSAELLVLNHICQTVCDKANMTIEILHKLFNNDLDKDLREQVLQFLLQIKQREVKFSGMGFFYFGYNFIRKFYVSIATVLVIMIQMRIT